jgi:membrane-associated phospholipid phosphatase
MQDDRKSSRKTGIEKADLATARKAGGWRDSPVLLALGNVSDLADQPPLYALCAGTAVVGVLRGDGRLFRTGLRMLAAEWMATRAKSVVKHRIDRTRPRRPVEGGRYSMKRGDSHESELNSFPSGHTAGAVSVARAFASEYPQHAGKAALAAAFVGAIQIPRCKHYLSDVGVGAAIGLAAGSIAAKSRANRGPDLVAANDRARRPTA